MEQILPDRRVVAVLKREAARRIRKDAHKHFDIRWDDRGCLCVFERTFQGSWSVRRELWDADGNPRQATMEDVWEVISNRYGWCEQVDNWRKRWEERKYERKRTQARDRRDLAERAAAHLIRVAKEGFRPYAFISKPDEPRPENENVVNDVKVVDRRRDFLSEAS